MRRPPAPAAVRYAEALGAARRVERDLTIAHRILRGVAVELSPHAGPARVLTRSTAMTYDDACRLVDRLLADPTMTLEEVAGRLRRGARVHVEATGGASGLGTARDASRRRVETQKELVAAVRDVDAALVRAHDVAFLLAMDLSAVRATARTLRQDLGARGFVDASMPVRAVRLALETTLVFADRGDLMDFLTTTAVQQARRRAIETTRRCADLATSELAAVVSRPAPALGTAPGRRALGFRGPAADVPAPRLPATPRRLLAAAVAVAPAQRRTRYAEEWAAELDELHPDDRIAHLLGLLRSAADLRVGTALRRRADDGEET